jgi:hypothetical protein
MTGALLIASALILSCELPPDGIVIVTLYEEEGKADITSFEVSTRRELEYDGLPARFDENFVTVDGEKGMVRIDRTDLSIAVLRELEGGKYKADYVGKCDLPKPKQF